MLSTVLRDRRFGMPTDRDEDVELGSGVNEAPEGGEAKGRSAATLVDQASGGLNENRVCRRLGCRLSTLLHMESAPFEVLMVDVR